jgi:hypothetical protein
MPSQYLVPRQSAKTDDKLGWLRESVEDGESYLKSQRSYRDIDKAIDIIDGRGGERLPKNQSRLHINMAKRDVRESVATLANMRPLWGYKTDNAQFKQLTEILNKLLMAWYLGTFADRSIRKALQWAAVGCKGYVSPGWKNDFWMTGRGDIALTDYGPKDVLPFQMGRDHDLQKAYAVTIRDEVPYARAAALYPTCIDLLDPDRSTPTWMRRGARRVQKFLSPVLERFGPGRGRESDETTFPTVDIYRTYILDLTYNDSPTEVEMGEPGTKWCYKVPPYKSEIATGEMNSANQMMYRKATLEDALLYPLRRMITWTNVGVIRDNTATDWHAKVPIIPFELDDWPWSFLGNSMTHDAETLQESANTLARSVDDSANARLDPALQYDESTISQGLMDRFNPRVGGQRIKTNMQMGEGIKPVLQPSYYDVPSWIPQFIDSLYEKMHYLMGTRDIQAIAKARQVPAGDSLEKLMELAGPILTDMSRNMERSMRDLGEMVKGDFMQYYDLKRRVQILGRDGVTEQDFDYDPANMIPSHLPDEIALIEMKRKMPDSPSRASIVERAKAHIGSCYFHITPNSLHQITQLTRKLLLLQLYKAGFPIDPWFVAEANDIPDFGDPEKLRKVLDMEDQPVPSDRMGRWIMWMELQQKLGGQKGQPGRKGTSQSGGAVVQKDGGTRSTQTQSQK